MSRGSQQAVQLEGLGPGRPEAASSVHGFQATMMGLGMPLDFAVLFPHP